MEPKLESNSLLALIHIHPATYVLHITFSGQCLLQFIYLNHIVSTLLLNSESRSEFNDFIFFYLKMKQVN